AFENRSSEKDSEYFSDGISEELLNVLSKVPGLRVAARTSSFYFKVKPASLKEIARELNVFYLVEGSVQRDGSRARIGASLFRADTGDTIWADRFDTELKDIFTAQDEIARLIASKLSLNLSAPSRPARVVDPAMHGLVLEGRYFLTQRDTGFPRAEAAFAQALKLDPEFAPAHAGLAAVHVLKAVFRIIDGVGGNAAGLAEGRRFAQQALALDASLVDAHSTAGYEALLSGRFNESEQHFQRGLAVNPNDAFTHHWRAHLLARLGQLDRALEENALAAELDPFSWALLSGYSGQLALACRHQDTLTALERLLAIRPNFLPAQGLAAVQMLRLGRSAEAIALARQVLENPQPSQRQWADVSAVQVLHEGQLDGDVRTYAAKVLASYPAEDPRRPALLAAAGRFEEALVTPIKSPVDPFNARFYFWAEAWDPIRDEPRFEQRIAQLGLTKEYKVARETLQRMLKQPKLKKP
ncbi:MAG: tetratricopeptide repeat protein, partial [Opitutaceae bacterium]|nr:tetratricopeptide repeat protein [Opitutaceae bacterium]